jgi:hypothetical protein
MYVPSNLLSMAIRVAAPVVRFPVGSRGWEKTPP